MTRVALYSHDALGLGHIRRTLALSRALSALRPRPDLLVLSGAREAAVLPRPAGCDIVGLPGMAKQGQGRYAARDLPGVTPAELVAMRSAIAEAALASFAPDLLVVDRHPRGVGGELEAALRALHGRTRVVLGLRDILDEPAAAAEEWARDGAAEALDAWYDAVWVYGDRRVHDLSGDLDIPARLATEVSFTGYLARGREPWSAHGIHGSARVLGLVGGGADGAGLARAFAHAARHHGIPSDLVLGSQMPADERGHVHRAAAGSPGLRVHDFVPDMAPLLGSAGAVVSMGGYNTACEVLDRGLPTLMVPRVWPRREQLVRATRLARHEQVSVLHPSRLTSDAVAEWVVAATEGRREPPGGQLELDGLARVRRLAHRLLDEERADVAV